MVSFLLQHASAFQWVSILAFCLALVARGLDHDDEADVEYGRVIHPH